MLSSIHLFPFSRQGKIIRPVLRGAYGGKIPLISREFSTLFLRKSPPSSFEPSTHCSAKHELTKIFRASFRSLARISLTFLRSLRIFERTKRVHEFMQTLLGRILRLAVAADAKRDETKWFYRRTVSFVSTLPDVVWSNGWYSCWIFKVDPLSSVVSECNALE